MQAAVVVGMMRGNDYDDFGTLKDGIDGIRIIMMLLVHQQQEDVGINDKIEVQRDKNKKVEVSSLRGLKFQRKAPRKKELKKKKRKETSVQMSRTNSSASNTLMSIDDLDQLQGESITPKWYFNPDSTGKAFWDIFMSLLIIYSTIEIPLRIAYNLEAEGFEYAFDWFVDVMFFLDMLVTFRTGLHDKNDNTLIYNSKLIAKNYLLGWFFIDLVSTVPFDEIIAPFVHASKSTLRSTKLIRTIRLVRLVKLMRILKFGRLKDKLEDFLPGNAGLFKLLELFITVTFLAHILGCLWFIITNSDYSKGEIDWVSVTNSTEKSTTTKYLLSLYFVFTTMTTVGFGDIVATNDLEMGICVLLMIIGAAIFGYIAGSVSVLLEEMDIAKAKNKEKMNLLKEYQNDRHIPPLLRQRMKFHLRYMSTQKTVLPEEKLLSRFLSRDQIALMYEHYENDIAGIRLFHSSVQRSLVVKLLHKLNPFYCEKGEFIFELGEIAEQVYVLRSGSLYACLPKQVGVMTLFSSLLGNDDREYEVVDGLQVGCFFGQDAVGRRKKDRLYSYAAACESFCECYFISAYNLANFRKNYPCFYADLWKAEDLIVDQIEDIVNTKEVVVSNIPKHVVESTTNPILSNIFHSKNLINKDPETLSIAMGGKIRNDNKEWKRTTMLRKVSTPPPMFRPVNSGIGLKRNLSTSRQCISGPNQAQTTGGGGQAASSVIRPTIPLSKQISEAKQQECSSESKSIMKKRAHTDMSASMLPSRVSYGIGSTLPPIESSLEPVKPLNFKKLEAANNLNTPNAVSSPNTPNTAKTNNRTGGGINNPTTGKPTTIVSPQHATQMMENMDPNYIPGNVDNPLPVIPLKLPINQILSETNDIDEKGSIRTDKSNKANDEFTFKSPTDNAEGEEKKKDGEEEKKEEEEDDDDDDDEKNKKKDKDGENDNEVKPFVPEQSITKVKLSIKLEPLDPDLQSRSTKILSSITGQTGSINPNNSGNNRCSSNNNNNNNETKVENIIASSGESNGETISTDKASSNNKITNEQSPEGGEGTIQQFPDNNHNKSANDVKDLINNIIDSKRSSAQNSLKDTVRTTDSKRNSINNNVNNNVNNNNNNAKSPIVITPMVDHSKRRISNNLQQSLSTPNVNKYKVTTNPHDVVRSLTSTSQDDDKKRRKKIEINQNLVEDSSELENVIYGFSDKSKLKLLVDGSIHPDHKVKVFWDIWMSIVILYSVIIVPYRIGFEQDATGFFLVFDYVIDCVFAIDIVISFFTGYYDSYGHLITERKHICMHYLKGWFFIDFMSTVPFDVIFKSAISSTQALRSVKLLRVLKLIRLLKLARLLKLGNLIARYQDKIDLNPATMSLLFNVIVIGFIAHLVACLLFGVSTFTKEDGWIQDYCPYEKIGMNETTGTAIWSRHCVGTASAGRKYITALYWAFSIMTTIGYGDIVADHNNQSELILLCVVMLVGTTTLSYIIGTLMRLIENVDPGESLRKKQKQILVGYINDTDINKLLSRHLKNHHDYYLDIQSGYDHESILKDFPAFLRREVLEYTNQDTLYTLPIFRIMQSEYPGFIPFVSSLIHPSFCGIGEYLYRRGEEICEFYILIKGTIRIECHDKTTYMASDGSLLAESILLLKQEVCVVHACDARGVAPTTLYTMPRHEIRLLESLSPSLFKRLQNIVISNEIKVDQPIYISKRDRTPDVYNLGLDIVNGRPRYHEHELISMWKSSSTSSIFRKGGERIRNMFKTRSNKSTNNTAGSNRNSAKVFPDKRRVSNELSNRSLQDENGNEPLVDPKILASIGHVTTNSALSGSDTEQSEDSEVYRSSAPEEE